MIVVHHLENSRSQRVLWLLEELQLPYEVKRYSRDPKTHLAPPELLAVHPLGKSPVVIDAGHTLAETGAIIEDLLELYGEGRLVPPAGSEDRRLYRYWLHFAEGSAMPPAVMKLVFRMLPTRVPFFMRPIAGLIGKGAQEGFLDPTLQRQMQFMEAHLHATGWFAGRDFSAADIMMSFPLEVAAARGDLSSQPQMRAWLDRIHGRPAYQAALQRGGPYAYA